MVRNVIVSNIKILLGNITDEMQSDDLECDAKVAAIDDNTLLISDLGLTSVDFIDLFVGLETAIGRAVGFHDLLMVNGKYVSDLSVGQLTDYLVERLKQIESSGATHTAEIATESETAPAADKRGGIASTVDAAMIARFRAILPTPVSLPDPRQKHGRVLFLLSPPRSGSTLLQIVLAGHPQLFAPPELHLLWFRDLKQRRQIYSQEANRHLTSGTIRAMMELDGLSVEQATAFMQRCEDEGMLARDVYAVIQERLGERLLVDKTPSYAYSPEVLERCERYFDEPLYLHLVRHPGGMIQSFIDAKLERTLPFMMRHEHEYTREQFAELAWGACHQNILDFLDGIPAERQYRVGYEHFVTDPGTTLKGVCQFLKLDYYPSMIEPYQDKKHRMADGVSLVSQMSGDLKFHLHSRIEPEAADRWRRYLSEDSLGESTWSLAQRLGYRRQP